MFWDPMGFNTETSLCQRRWHSLDLVLVGGSVRRSVDRPDRRRSLGTTLCSAKRSASGPEIGLPGRISAGFWSGKPQNRPSGRRADVEVFSIRIRPKYITGVCGINAHRNPMNLQGLWPSILPNPINLYGLGTSMAPNLVDS